MSTGNFQTNLSASSGNAIVEILNGFKIFETETAEYKDDYYIKIDLFTIEVCDMATNISALALAPIPNILDEDTKSQQAAKIHEVWSNYPKIGIQLYLDTGNGLWQKQGQPIVCQNIPFQLPVNILSPYLASANIKTLGRKSRLGAQVISSSGWSQLSGNDEISIKGDWRLEFSLIEKKSKPVSNWFPIGVDLPNNIPIEVRPRNEKRRSLILTNAGKTKIYLFFGSEAQVATLNCPYLLPDGSFNLIDLGVGYIPSQISAISIDETNNPPLSGKLVGMEGSV